MSPRRRPWFYAKSFTVFPPNEPPITVSMQMRHSGIAVQRGFGGWVDITVNRLRFDAALTLCGSRLEAARWLLQGAKPAPVAPADPPTVRPGEWTFKNPNGGLRHVVFGHQGISGKFSVTVRLVVNDHQRFEGKPGLQIRFHTGRRTIEVRATVAAWTEYRRIASSLGLHSDFGAVCLLMNRRLEMGLETQPEGSKPSTTRAALKAEFRNSWRVTNRKLTAALAA